MEFQVVIPVLIAFAISVVLGPVIIPFLRRLKMGQTERTEGVQSHLKKAGTPTMGGVIFPVSYTHLAVYKRQPMNMQVKSGHPAKRTFQAIRIELNRELDVLRDSLDGMIDILDDGGRLCIITFHSLEDRIVKTIFRKNENPCTCPSDFPVCVCGKKSKGKVITRKPILPGETEMEENPRSKSAKLRIFERVL